MTTTSITRSFRAADTSSARIHVLSDGRAVRDGATGLMLLDSVGGQFIRYIDTLDPSDELAGLFQ